MQPTEPIRVLVVEDSLTVRKLMVEVISAAPGFQVVGEACDGEAGVELCRQLRPDVVSLDMILPGISGVETTERIMAYCPTPILIVSASTNRGELFKTYEALAAGAVDVLEKPRADQEGGSWVEELLSTLRIVSRIRVITHPRGRLGSLGRRRPEPVVESGPEPAGSSSRTARRLIAIGGSTGGPGALLTILRGLPKEYPLPLLVVIHISQPFAVALAEWLASQVALPVRCARDGERLPAPGQAEVLLAPADRHLELVGPRLRLTHAPERHSCRPSVDVLFETVAREAGPEAVACLLTGMGKDGAEGLLAVRNVGGATIAQDEASSVVFGMPGEAVRLGAAAQVLPLLQIAPALVRLAGGGWT